MSSCRKTKRARGVLPMDQVSKPHRQRPRTDLSASNGDCFAANRHRVARQAETRSAGASAWSFATPCLPGRSRAAFDGGGDFQTKQRRETGEILRDS